MIPVVFAGTWYIKKIRTASAGHVYMCVPTISKRNITQVNSLIVS